MAYEIGTVADGDITSAKTVALGGNYRVYISPQNVIEVGSIRVLSDKDDSTSNYDADTHGKFVKASGYKFLDALNGFGNLPKGGTDPNFTNPAKDATGDVNVNATKATNAHFIDKDFALSVRSTSIERPSSVSGATNKPKITLIYRDNSFDGDAYDNLAGNPLNVASNANIVYAEYNDPGPPAATISLEDQTQIGEIKDATVEFSSPAIESYDGLYFQRGYSRDLVLTTPGDASGQIRTITGLKDDEGLLNIKGGAELVLYEMPDLTSFKLIVQTDSFADPSTVSNPISVPAGLNSSRWVAAGMTPEPEITFTQKFVSNSEIVQRLSGRHVTLMVEIYKNDQVLSSRAIYTEAILNWSHDSGEGEAPVMRNSTARFKDALYFFTS